MSDIWYTPRKECHLLADLANSCASYHILYDPFCGDGRLLHAAWHRGSPGLKVGADIVDRHPDLIRYHNYMVQDSLLNPELALNDLNLKDRARFPVIIVTNPPFSIGAEQMARLPIVMKNKLEDEGYKVKRFVYIHPMRVVSRESYKRICTNFDVELRVLTYRTKFDRPFPLQGEKRSNPVEYMAITTIDFEEKTQPTILTFEG